MKFVKPKTTGIARSASLILISTFIAFLITACGSGSSSSSGGGVTSLGKASISGNVNSGVAFNQAARSEAMLLTSIFTFAVPAAHAGTIYTVSLTGPGPGGTTTTDTDASGNFSFQNLLPGAYSIQVMGGTAPPVDVNLAADTNTKLELSLNGNLLESQVIDTPGSTDTASISGEVEDGNSSDDDQNTTDDQDSDDDQSVDDGTSEDDNESSDDDDENDDVNDDDNSNDTQSE